MEQLVSSPNTNFDKWYQRLLRYLVDGFDEGRVYTCRTGDVCSFMHAVQVRFDLSNNKVPALTTKQIYLRKVFYELQWYMLGLTDVTWLQERGVRVWNEWVDHRLNLEHNRKDGELGPVYGALWRNFGATKVSQIGCFDEEKFLDDGFDQLAYVTDQLVKNPSSRRIILSAWDPRTQHTVALPPCHPWLQFNVVEGRLYASLTCRSTDAFFGLPWNILAYAFLTKILGGIAGLMPAELVVTMNNCHLYQNQIQAAQEQIAREPFDPPRVALLSGYEGKPIHTKPWLYTWDDFEVLTYEHGGPLKNQPTIAV